MRWPPRGPAHRAAARAAVMALGTLLPVSAVAVLVGGDRSSGNFGAPLRVRGPADGFERPSGAAGLGTAPGGAAWTPVSGQWGISAGRAMVVAPVPDPAAPNLAVVALGGDGSAEVRLATAADGAGLVFRYLDARNYWAVVAFPFYSTWSVIRTLGGRVETVATTGLSATGDGTTVGVRLRGPTIDIAVDHEVLKTVRSPVLSSAEGVGMVATGPDVGVARFDDFRTSPA